VDDRVPVWPVQLGSVSALQREAEVLQFAGRLSAGEEELVRVTGVGRVDRVGGVGRSFEQWTLTAVPPIR